MFKSIFIFRTLTSNLHVLQAHEAVLSFLLQNSEHNKIFFRELTYIGSKSKNIQETTPITDKKKVDVRFLEAQQVRSRWCRRVVQLPWRGYYIGFSEFPTS